MKHSLNIRTTQRVEFIDITRRLEQLIAEEGLSAGRLLLFVPHTTAAVTINENADPDVLHDMIGSLNRLIPFTAGYRHAEGNSAAHIKSSLIGCTEHIIVDNGKLVLGTWQGVFFCEFDGPRSRRIFIKPIRDAQS